MTVDDDVEEKFELVAVRRTDSCSDALEENIDTPGVGGKHDDDDDDDVV